MLVVSDTPEGLSGQFCVRVRVLPSFKGSRKAELSTEFTQNSKTTRALSAGAGG